MATQDDDTTAAVAGGHRASSEDSERSREEPGFPQDYTMTAIPIEQRPPIPIPDERQHRLSSRSNTGRSRRSTGGTYQRVPDSDPDIRQNRAYGVADRHRTGIQRAGSQQQEPDDEARPLLNQPDKLFGMNMKNYILSSLGLSNIPGTNFSCTWIAMLFYLILAAWGVGILTTATQTVFTSLTKEDCKKMIPSFVLAMVVGVFFILLGLYWVLVFWWEKVSSSASRRVSFSLLTILWFILAVFFVGTAASLATEVYEHSNMIANFTGNIPCDGTESSMEELPYHFNLIPLLALGSMVILWAVYVCVFLVQCVAS